MIKQVLVLRKDLNMRKGKMISQGAHAAMKFLAEKIKTARKENTNEVIIKLSLTECNWLENLSTKVVVSVDSEEELNALIQRAKDKEITVNSIVDAGKTEFNNIPTLTCAAFGPNEAEHIDQITGHLKLL